MQMTFGQAFDRIRSGKGGMRLPQWKPDVIIRAQIPDEHSKMTAPYLYVESHFGKVPITLPFSYTRTSIITTETSESNSRRISMIELFSTDWEVIN